MESIRIQGARTHNLKDIDLELPRSQLLVITGLSGSGKSSLAFDTIYAEGQRRYVESLSIYARQFLSVMEKPDVDHIEGLSPAISIEQKTTSHNPRSTVGTTTEIHDYLRLLFARAGIPRCPDHDVTLEAQTVSEMVDETLALTEGTKIMVLAPVRDTQHDTPARALDELRAQGFVRARIDGQVVELEAPAIPSADPPHTIEAVVDRLRVRPDISTRLAESFETALALSGGTARVAFIDTPQHEDLNFSANFACPSCGYSMPEPEPKMFSFNNPAGACVTCGGLGTTEFFDPDRVVANPHLSLAGGAVRGWDRRNAYYFQLIQSLATHYDFDIDQPFESLSDTTQNIILYGSGEEAIAFEYHRERGKPVTKEHPFEGVIPNMERRFQETESQMVREELRRYRASRICPECNGTRLNKQARHVFVNDYTLPDVTAMSVGDAQAFFQNLVVPGWRGSVATQIVSEITQRLGFLINVGLEYLTLDRGADTLSGGEAQRIRLASQIGAGLAGVMYVLDEPSIGLHQRDNQRLLNTLKYLRDLGNTVIVVEHDEEAIRTADYVVDMGPGAGIHGGYIVAQGSPEAIAGSSASLTGQYLAGQRRIPVPGRRTPPDWQRCIGIRNPRGHNLKGEDVSIPAGLFTCVTGVSGSGKSTLITDTLYHYLSRALYGSKDSHAPCDGIDGIDQIDKVVDIDQSPIGRTPRSNPATYTGLFAPVRELFAATPEARSRGYSAGRFSFNVKGGRCEACQGDGVIKVEMHFLPDVYVSCDVCKGRRYNRETLDIQYKGKNIYDVLEMTVEEALEFFHAVPAIKRKLQTLMDVGLPYIKLGQNAVTLSGGEAQRIKLARELSKRETGRTLYILDEPTTGLHFHDIEQLLVILNRLRDNGNTVVVIEHNLDVIKTADWVVDIGPEGGKEGGHLVAAGTPESLATESASYTGRYLKRVLHGEGSDHPRQASH